MGLYRRLIVSAGLHLSGNYSRGGEREREIGDGIFFLASLVGEDRTVTETAMEQ